MNLEALLQKASQAKSPSHRQANARWSHLIPIVSKLRQNGFSYPEAVKWLIAEGAIAANQEHEAVVRLRQANSNMNYRVKRRNGQPYVEGFSRQDRTR